MLSMILRKRVENYKGEIHGDKVFELQMRYVGPVETEYSHISYVTKSQAVDMVEATNGEIHFLYPEQHPHYPNNMEKHADGTEYPAPTRGLVPWIGVDWDGTFAHYEEWQGPHKSGAPIQKMVDRIKGWIAEGKLVKIITARVGNQNKAYADYCRKIIQDELEAAGLPRLQVTATKDFAMIEMWDDRCISVVPNTGMTLVEYLEEKRHETKHHESD